MKRPKTQDERDLLLYESRLQRPVRMKMPEFERDDRMRHVIFSGQFSVPFLEELAGIADMIRMLSKSRAGQDFLINLLPHKRAMLYFTQPSTRTFLSFMAACQILGITCNEVRDPRTSSETKGETRFDSIRMFSSYFDVIIMRSPIARLAESCAYLMNDLETSRQSQRADRERRLRGRRASDAGAVGHLHAAAVVPIRQPARIRRRPTGSTSCASERVTPA